jgi:hypothetical protein
VALGPAEVHPEEHLGPVSGLGPARPGADRDDRRPLVVLAVEEERGALALEVALELGVRPVELGAQLRIVRLADELERRFEVIDPLEDARPELDLRAEIGRLAEDLRRGPLVVPEAGLARQPLEIGEARLLGREVKDAPRSTGSAPPGRGRSRRPSVSSLEVLEQDRTELDESEGRLAPGDDGVHAGTVAVVGADAAVAIAVEGRRVAAVPAITFAGDEIDECRFLGLLQVIPLSSTRMGTAGSGRGGIAGVRGVWLGGCPEYRWPIPLRQEGNPRKTPEKRSNLDPAA